MTKKQSNFVESRKGIHLDKFLDKSSKQKKIHLYTNKCTRLVRDLNNNLQNNYKLLIAVAKL